VTNELERLIRLEGKMESMQGFMEASAADRVTLHKEISEIGQKLDRIHTFGGAIAFLVTGIWAILSIGKEWLIGHIR